MNKKNVFMNFAIILCIVLSYWVLDFGIRVFSYESYKYYSYKLFAPSLFSLGWISLFVGIFYLLNKKRRRIFYIVSLVIFMLIAYSQYLHFKILERFYSFNDLFLVGEANDYFWDAIVKTDVNILVLIGISFVFAFVVLKLSKKYGESYRDNIYFKFVVCFTIFCSFSFFLCAHFRLGDEEFESSYEISYNSSNVYKDFNNPNKNMQLAGLYETVPRSIYVYFRDKLNDSSEEAFAFVEEYLDKNEIDYAANEYTGVLKDKNVILIMMESIDNFLVTERVMPTLYKLSNEGLNFTNRYSPTFGGGQTINSEFAINTGLYTSLDGVIYNSENTYRTAIANIFREAGYSTVSVHFNNGFYYNRTQFHERLGYDEHYALLDMEELEHDSYDYTYDSNLIKNPTVSDFIVRDDKFFTFVTTYSAHLPYTIYNDRCIANKYDLKDDNSELTCLNNLARETDEMLALLLDKLEEEGKLDNTVLVLASDHYAYDYTYVEKTKKVSNKYLLQHTPFVIWSSDLEHEDVDVLVDTADLVPTVLNLFGIEYNPSLYVGEDAFSLDRKDYIYFSEDTYYDGDRVNDKNNNVGDIDIYNEIKETISFNDNLISSNYLKIKEE